LSPSLITDSATPEGVAASGQSRPSLWKAQPLSEEDRAELGLPSPSLDSDPEVLRARERHSKNNNDRPSKVHSPVIHEVEMHLDFSGDSKQGRVAKAPSEHLLEGAVIAELAAPVARAPKSRASPVNSTRKSLRGAGSTSVPILDKAIRRAEEKDPGNHSKSLSDFAILQNSSYDHLLAVAADSCILFPSAAGNPAPILSLLRAKELAQAELALAQEKIEAEHQKSKEQSQLETREESQPSSPGPSPPVGSGAGRRRPHKPTMRKKIQKKVPSREGRMVTRQARARGLGSQ
jgi:hypothetical protein